MMARLRTLLCRIGIDSACRADPAELRDRRAQMETLTARVRLLAREYGLPQPQPPSNGGQR